MLFCCNVRQYAIGGSIVKRFKKGVRVENYHAITADLATLKRQDKGSDTCWMIIKSD